jgi:hypothetical protein
MGLEIIGNITWVIVWVCHNMESIIGTNNYLGFAMIGEPVYRA